MDKKEKGEEITTMFLMPIILVLTAVLRVISMKNRMKKSKKYSGNVRNRSNIGITIFTLVFTVIMMPVFIILKLAEDYR